VRVTALWRTVEEAGSDVINCNVFGKKQWVICCCTNCSASVGMRIQRFGGTAESLSPIPAGTTSDLMAYWRSDSYQDPERNPLHSVGWCCRHRVAGRDHCVVLLVMSFTVAPSFLTVTQLSVLPRPQRVKLLRFSSHKVATLVSKIPSVYAGWLY